MTRSILLLCLALCFAAGVYIGLFALTTDDHRSLTCRALGGQRFGFVTWDICVDKRAVIDWREAR